MSDFSNRLRELREQREASLEEVAKGIGVTRSTLSRYENGKMTPSIDMVILLAKFFNVTLEYMAGREDDALKLKEQRNRYQKIIDKCISENIAPEKLEQLIDILKK